MILFNCMYMYPEYENKYIIVIVIYVKYLFAHTYTSRLMVKGVIRCTNSGTHLYPESTTLITERQRQLGCNLNQEHTWSIIALTPKIMTNSFTSAKNALRPRQYFRYVIKLATIFLSRPYFSQLEVNWMWHPRKHETLTQCCFNVGPAAPTMGQHWNNIGSTSRVCWDWIWGALMDSVTPPPRLRGMKWNINAAPDEALILLCSPRKKHPRRLTLKNGGEPSRHESLTQCWVNVGPPSTTSAQH